MQVCSSSPKEGKERKEVERRNEHLRALLLLPIVYLHLISRFPTAWSSEHSKILGKKWRCKPDGTGPTPICATCCVSEKTA